MISGETRGDKRDTLEPANLFLDTLEPTTIPSEAEHQLLDLPEAAPLDTLEPETLFLDTPKAKPRSWYPCYHGNKIQEGESEFFLFDPRKVSTAGRSYQHTNVQLYLPT